MGGLVRPFGARRRWLRGVAGGVLIEARGGRAYRAIETRRAGLGRLEGWAMKLLRTALLVVLVLAALAGAAFLAVSYAAANSSRRILAPGERARHAQFIASGLSLVTPPGSGPFPTVLLIPGCGGLTGYAGHNPIMDEYARSAVEAGWAAAILDSYAPRDWAPNWARRRVCSGVRLPGFRRAADVLAGLDLLQKDPRVDHGRLRIASWSHGGWAVGDLVTLRDPGDGSFTRTMDAVEALQFTYPYCGFPAEGGKRDWTWRGGVRMVFAEHDQVQPQAGCLPLVARARKAGSTVEEVVVPGATHAFDERMQTPGSRFRFDPAAAAHAHAGFVAWLRTPAPPRP
jgi:dienelactone hydrolase